MNRIITIIKTCAVLLCFSGTALSQTDYQRHEYTRIDDYAQYTPMAAGLALGWLGVEARHSNRDRVLLTGTAFCTMTALAGGLK